MDFTMAAEARRRQNLRDSLTIIGALLGLYWFAASFFLAKKNLSLVSSCHEPEALLTQVLGLSEDHIRTLHEHRVLSRSSDGTRQGCWMPRRVDSVIILLVDALRFDFCLYNLPESVGSRLPLAADFHNTTTRLFRFVADPPTVTMQRLKALTTGGLPTFADISANFGGASLEEDSWVHQLMKNTHHQFASRGRHEPTKSAFVGDDTWLDLFPGLFTENYPYPSFNTRDLDTVDNGCIEHLPNLTRRFLSNELEVVIVHFLGVDHVGHTYGPHNQHMDAKLRQMDKTLADVLETMDSATSCQAALIFGDHGMTEDGNHGGGTEEEVSAALFVHVSPACGDMTEALSLERDSSCCGARRRHLHLYTRST
jgi:GPI ethanolamine phosphate transferase 3 subunit O